MGSGGAASASRPIPAPSAAAEPRQAADVLPYPGSGPIGTVKGKIASLTHQ